MSIRLAEGGDYRLMESAGATGPAAATGAPNTLRVVRLDGVEVLNLAVDPASFILTKLDPGFPTVRSAGAPVPDTDGEVDTTKNVGARAVTAEVVVAQANTGPLVDQLTAVMHPGSRWWLYLGRFDWPVERRILGRAATFSCPPATLRTAQLGFHCAKGLLESAVDDKTSLNPVGGATGGFSFPITFPLSLAAGDVAGATLVTTNGTAPPAMSWTLYGPFSDPILQRTDTGERLSFPGLTVAAGDYLAVSFDDRTALLNNDPTQSRYNKLDFATSTWWRLPASGTTPVLFSATGTGMSGRWGDRPTRAVLTVRNRYL